jgi:hypothetical protein
MKKLNELRTVTKIIVAFSVAISDEIIDSKEQIAQTGIDINESK